VKAGDPVDSTLCGVPLVLVHVQVTLPPTATVSTAGFMVPFRLLAKRILPTRTAAEVGIEEGCAIALKVRGDPVRLAVAVMVTGPAVLPRVTFTADTPEPSVATVVAEGVPPVALQVTSTPGTPFPN
jgi:hypothetical protein